MQEETINRALLELRKRTIRERRPGLESVEALLKLRRVPMPSVGRGKPANSTGKHVIRRLALTALRDGPKRVREVAAYVDQALPNVAPDQAYMRTARCLSRMRVAGLAERIGEKEVNIRNKLSRGKFSAAFFLESLKAVGVSELRL